jgi:hypothetical protein
MLIFWPVKSSNLKLLQEIPTYLVGCEGERHEILLIDSNDSMAGIKLVDLGHEFTQRFGLYILVMPCWKATLRIGESISEIPGSRYC